MATTSSGQDATSEYGVAVLTLAGQIRTEIESGAYPHGTQLPSTKQLAADWHASATTVARAMKVLEHEGLVISKDRSGRIVNHPPEKAARTPVVLLIGGYAGSGKTQLGRIVASHTHWALLDKDSTTRAVVEAALQAIGQSPHTRESPEYRTIIRPAEYQALMTGVLENLECGTSVVATAPFVAELADEEWCEQARRDVEAHGGRLAVAWVRCDAETMHRYITYRGAARDAEKLADWKGYINSINLDYEPVVEHQIIDNNGAKRSLEQQAEEMLARITA
ncbi:GntR family transcriptional regulator [Amycolatopsis sp. NPDC023774]|uniref:GntR family transcriptional regulator n=1 Tax=Amycolatopsis sp. NPDC023774 TaxID=3155015 RepID=UPI0033F083F2